MKFQSQSRWPGEDLKELTLELGYKRVSCNNLNKEGKKGHTSERKLNM